MTKKSNLPADNFWSDVNFTSIVDTVKGIYMSDGAMSTLLDFERVLDQADLYAFKNWINGELVQGPTVGRYTCRAVFMWPHKLMPDPRGSLRLINVGCRVTFGKGEIDIPVEVKGYDDFQQGTRYPKMKKKRVWFVEIDVPIELMDDIKEGTIDLADQTIDLSDIEDAYDEDLDDATKNAEGEMADDQAQQHPENMPGLPGMGI